ncbi:MAG: TerC family protein [Phycisphaeraceae bacterium]|nr:TerC family protein [Phycisphaeraceae bacterium]
MPPTPLFPAFLTLLSAPPAGHPGIALLYAGFIALIIVFLALDLGVFHRRAHVVSLREAATWSVVWATCALSFTLFIYFAYNGHWLGLGLDVPIVGRPGEFTTVSGATAAGQYLAGYIVEWSLSVDNLFVIAVIFSYFRVPPMYQHRVLFWGILGALVMRGGMIALGAALIQRYAWTTYLFGGFLIFTAIKMALSRAEDTDLNKSLFVRIVRALFPISTRHDGQHFFTRIPRPGHADATRLAATPLFLALIVVEFTDLVFAVDSVPAIFAITGDPFLVLTSNVFAILGLRSLFFLLADMLRRFHYLKPALVLILLFVGVKMLLVHTQLKINTGVSLLVVVGLLGAGVAASFLLPPSAAASKQP